MAYKRGLLTQTNFNELQERLLVSVLVQEQMDKFEDNENEFEKQLMIHRPDVWHKMQEEREEANEMGFDEVVWRSPESLEEFEEIEKILQLQYEEELEQEQSEVSTSPLLSDIDFDALGD